MPELRNNDGALVWRGEHLSDILELPQPEDSQEELTRKADANAAAIAELEPIEEEEIEAAPWCVINPRTGEIEQRCTSQAQADKAAENASRATDEFLVEQAGPDAEPDEIVAAPKLRVERLD